MKTHKSSACYFCGLLMLAYMLALPTQFLEAGTIVIPGSLANQEGNSADLGFGLFGSGAGTKQYQITGTELSLLGLQVGDQIAGFRMRQTQGGISSPSSDITTPALDITLAQAANPIESMSTTFALNMIHPIQVRSGSFTLAAGSMPFGSVPNAFGPLVQFNTLYTYQGGDLVLMYTKQPFNGVVVTDAAVSFSGNGTSYRWLSSNSYQAEGGAFNNVMSVFALEIVPEPSTSALFVVSMFTILIRKLTKLPMERAPKIIRSKCTDC